jgi:hypothetical protein
LKSGDYRSSNEGEKSDAWKEFGLVVDRNVAELDFAACKSCHHALAYSSHIGQTCGQFNF